MIIKFNTWTILAFINAATITSLLLLIVGASLYISGEGFFSGIAHSFRRFYKRTSKKWELLDEPDEEYAVNKRSFSLTGPFLIIGGGLFFLILFLSYAIS